MSTRATILAQVARELGWRTGTFTTGTTNTATLDGYTTGDDTTFKGAILCMPAAAAEADRERVIEYWDDSARKATWVTARSVAAAALETFYIIPPGDLTRSDLNTALNDVLAEIRQTVRTVLPTIQNQTLYPLGRFSWIRYDDDVDGVFLRSSPNIIDNSRFDFWTDGAATVPTSWVLAGSGTVARVSGGSRSQYAAELTRAGADFEIRHVIGLLDSQLIGQQVTLSCDVNTITAAQARIGIYDGISTTYSSFHTGSGAYEQLTLTNTISALATDLRVLCRLSTSDGTADFSNFVMQEGSAVVDSLTDTGDQRWQEREAMAKVRQYGNQVVVELPTASARGSQVVIASGAPYPALSADTNSTDCPDSILIHGVVDQVVSRMPKGVARDRLEGLRSRHHQQFMRLSQRVRERPAVEMPFVSITRGI